MKPKSEKKDIRKRADKNARTLLPTVLFMLCMFFGKGILEDVFGVDSDRIGLWYPIVITSIFWIMMKGFLINPEIEQIVKKETEPIK